MKESGHNAEDVVLGGGIEPEHEQRALQLVEAPQVINCKGGELTAKKASLWLDPQEVFYSTTFYGSSPTRTCGEVQLELTRKHTSKQLQEYRHP